ncbi:MAG: hypothetical protein KJS68_15640 [Alphaproteobacteria bacterium]|nr:hypothetical protein [Alphaproteobacteria bacterium]
MKLKSSTLCTIILAAALSISPAFAADAARSPPKGWIIAGSTPQQYVFGTEKCANGKCAFIKAKTDTPSGFGTLMQEIAADNYLGKRLRLSAMLKTANASRAQLWMRMDGTDGKILGFYNMDDRPVTGTTDWKRYNLVLDVPEGTQDIAFGMFLNGKGEVWAEDFKLESVSKDVPVSSTQFRNAPVNMNFDQ